jgi:hypothetical protein
LLIGDFKSFDGGCGIKIDFSQSLVWYLLTYNPVEIDVISNRGILKVLTAVLLDSRISNFN